LFSISWGAGAWRGGAADRIAALCPLAVFVRDGDVNGNVLNATATEIAASRQLATQMDQRTARLRGMSSPHVSVAVGGLRSLRPILLVSKEVVPGQTIKLTHAR
jgi:hypothetical protein